MIKSLDAYHLISKERLEELNTEGYIFEHKKTKARVVVLENDDENKVFSIGFRTPPEDSTGVAHIVEHTVLCGSKEFPAKDPFIELAKGSMNTFLNAMTFPDKTIYPIASCNFKDFCNLMHVYLDAVFYPNIYKREEIFKQEGWHYELDSEDGELKYNGVVYNEMKGAFSSPEQVLFRVIQQQMLPDTPYGTESGGDPEFIPDLTYQNFLDFHSKYYHPSNSYIYLYGDMDMAERLEWMDEHYLSHFDYLKVDSKIGEQKPFEGMRCAEAEYSIGEDENTKDKTYLSFNTVIGKSTDRKLYQAFQILEYVLLENQGAPLKQALIDAGIGKDILSSYENGINQPIFSIISKNANESQKDEFLKVIHDTLTDIVEQGLDEKALKAAINYFEFRYREADFGTYPKGLMYGIQILESWLYDDKLPFIHICADETFAFLKESIKTGYYEELIQKYLLDNPHSALVIVKPKQGLSTARAKEVAKKLAKYKAGLSTEELKALVADTKALKAYQEEPSTKEELEKIPLLSIEDLDKNAAPFINEVRTIKDTKVVFHDIFTNKIGYFKFVFDITGYEEYIPYINLFSSLLGYMSTKEHTYLELANEINIHTGGIAFDAVVRVGTQKKPEHKLQLVVSMKALYEEFADAFAIIKEILSSTNLGDEKRLKEIISEIRSKLEMGLIAGGHTTAVERAKSYVSKASMYGNYLTGIGMYEYIKDWDENFEDRKDELIGSFRFFYQKLFGDAFTDKKQDAVISFTADESGYEILKPVLEDFLGFLQNRKDIFEEMPQTPGVTPVDYTKLGKNEGFKTPGQVQYVARAGSFGAKGLKYKGTLRVARTILSYDYLWNNVRVKGGAYGCMCSMQNDGFGYLVSYRDPNLSETNDIFEKTADYLAGFDAKEREMTKYIIGTIGAMDTPLTPAAKGNRSFSAYELDSTYEEIQQIREEVLGATVEDIRELADYYRAIIDDHSICVLGSEEKIKDNQDMFEEVKNLL
ncbi:MAG: insulinase family protein [Lachnospiraceae bacterium]|nr:insulinase family protein [Lachnospiraceae bacterium]